MLVGPAGLAAVNAVASNADNMLCGHHPLALVQHTIQSGLRTNLSMNSRRVSDRLYIVCEAQYLHTLAKRYLLISFRSQARHSRYETLKTPVCSNLTAHRPCHGRNIECHDVQGPPFVSRPEHGGVGLCSSRSRSGRITSCSKTDFGGVQR